MPLNNFGITDEHIWRSAQPDEQGIKDLAALGVRSILKLNTETPEETAWCAAHGIDFRPYPIDTFKNDPATIKNIAEAIYGLSQKGIVLVHCEHGRDRTGLVIGAYHILYDGWTVPQANAERKLFGVEGFIKLYDLDMDIILGQLAVKS